MRRLEVRIEQTTRTARPGAAGWGRGAHYYQWVCDSCGHHDKPEPAI
jgi:hypothetical protein